MKIFLYTDIHFCEYSSIVRAHGDKYSKRLEGLIRSINWAEAEAVKNNCDQIICLGDFFDHPDLNSRELTALQEINWANIPHTFIVGNHEASNKSLKYNSVSALQSFGFEVITRPKIMFSPDVEILMIPYCLEEDRKPLSEYWEGCDDLRTKRIIVTHNDIKGIKYGAFESKDGFDVSDIESSCDIFLNGHLHNGSKFCRNGINLGNLTGQNFSEDANIYNHCGYVLDTVTSSLDAIENPFAFNFYKLEINDEYDLQKIKTVKSNSVVSIKCLDSIIDAVRDAISMTSQILESRIITTHLNTTSNSLDTQELNDVDHLSKFIEFCKQRIDNSEILEEELSIICK